MAAAGSLSNSGWLPWEAFPAAGQARDARKMWAEVTGLQGGSNHTAFIALTENGDTPLPGSIVTALRQVRYTQTRLLVQRVVLLGLPTAGLRACLVACSFVLAA